MLRLSTYIANRIGESTEPCLTPKVTVNIDEKKPLHVGKHFNGNCVKLCINVCLIDIVRQTKYIGADLVGGKILKLCMRELKTFLKPVNALLFKTKHFLMIWLFIMHLAVSNYSFMLVNVSICYAFRPCTVIQGMELYILANF